MNKIYLFIIIFLLIIPALPFASADAQIPPKPSKPTGEVTLEVNEKETYQTHIEHENDIYIQFVWGDGSSTNWHGPYNKSIHGMGVTHIWNKTGIYEITAQVSYSPDGANASVSESLTVYVGYIGIHFHYGRHGKFYVQPEIENFANETIFDVSWDMKITPIENGIMLWSSDSQGDFNYLGVGKEKTMLSKLIFGFGKITILVNVTIPLIDTSITKEVSGFIVFFNVYITSRTEQVPNY